MMLVPSTFPDKNVRGDFHLTVPADMEHKMKSCIEDEFHSGRSVQTWQCLPSEGSLSSIESFPGAIEASSTSMFQKSLLLSDDDSGTDAGQDGSPLRGAFDHSADEGHANRRSEETPSRVKLMCSFGGKILPRPSDGKLRYVGGETRIVSVNRDVTYSELMSKMKEQYGQDLSLKYQLPNEDLDALISVSTDEDLQNMMEEYDRLEGGDGLQRLRVFLFSTSDVDAIIDPLGDPKKSEQWYVEAVNGILETSSKKSESGISVGGISARPSADNLVALDTMDPHSISHIEEQAALLLSKKMQDLHGACAGNSASSSPSLLPQQPHSRHLGKMNDHPYAMFNSEGQQHFALFNSDLGHSDLDHYYTNPRTEMLPSTHDHDRKVRGYNTDAMLPRVGSHGKLSRLQEQHDDPPHGHSDLDHYYANPRTEMLPATHDHDRKVRGYNTEAILPRVGSHGKLSRLQELHDDPPHGQQDLLSQDLLMEPRPRFIVQQPQPHILHVRQHPLEPNQDYRRPEYSLSDNGYPHLLQQHQPPTQPLHYHKDTIYRAEQYQQHHRHQLPEEAYPAHDMITQQHHIQHQEEYFPGHMYHRTSSHIDGSGSGISTHATSYQIGSSPSSPRLPFRDGRQSGLHQQLPMHRAYGLDHQYGRRSHVHEEAARTYRLSSSPPRYRDHHIDDQRPLLQHHAINQDRFPQDQVSVMFDQKKPPEVLPRAALPLFGPGFQEGPVYYQENSHRGGETRRHVQTSPHITSRLDYQDQLMQMEQLSLHNQSQRYHDHPDKAIDWQERNLETDEPRVSQVRMERQHELLEGNHNTEYESPVTMNGVYLDNQATTPFVVHGSGLGHAAHLVHASQRFTDSRVSLHDGSRIFPDEGVYSSRVKSSMSRPSSSSNVAGLVNDKPIVPTQEGPMATASFHSISLPVFDRSGVFEVPSDAISQWSANVDGATTGLNGQSELFPTIKSGVVDVNSHEPRATKDEVFPAYASSNQAARNTVAAQLSETGHLAEDMASSVLRSSLLEQGEQGVELAPQLTFTVQAWDKVLVHGDDMTPTCNDAETLCKEENLENLDQSTEVFDKVLDNTPEDPPTNIALAAEQEAISRGLQTIRNSDLEEIRELGSGTYGTVYHGKWRGTDVAIKRIKASCFAGKPLERERLVADFWREACTLSQLHHPNCVAFYGVVPDGPGGTLATVTEYMVNGSLKQVLQKKDRTIDRRKRLLIGTDAAFGMEYLHGKNIVHFDLKCENLLVNMRDPHRPICKVGDLGLSKVKRQTMVSGGVRGTLPWMAPELLSASSGMVTERVDVFSFGIVMWELLTGEEPYANMHYGAIIGGIVSNTLRPPIPNWCDPAWRSLMERCWAADPSARPSFSEIASELRAMASSLQSKN